MSLPEVLFHYCPPIALSAIIESGSLWLTHHTGMNDLRDTRWAETFIAKAMKERETPERTSLLNNVDLVFKANKAEIYVGSFSSKGDLLSQWRAYAEDGLGFAIGFRSSAFEAKWGVPMSSFVPEHTLAFIKVAYDDTLLEAAIKQVLDTQLDRASSDGDVIMDCSMAFRSLSLLFKNPAFREEDKWRLIYAPLMNQEKRTGSLKVIGKITDLRFRWSRYGLVPYFPCPFVALRRRDAIKELVLGPKNPSDPETIRRLLLLQGYHDVSVRRSAASYR
jgi:hypothetical protein